MWRFNTLICSFVMYYIYIHCIIKQYVSWELFNYRSRQFLSTEHLLILTILILSHLAGRLNCILNSFPTLFFFECFPNCIFANKRPFKSVRFHFTAGIDVSTIKKKKGIKFYFMLLWKILLESHLALKSFVLLSLVAHLEKFWRVAMLWYDENIWK